MTLSLSLSLRTCALPVALAVGCSGDKGADPDGPPRNEVPGDVLAATETASGRLLMWEPGTDNLLGEVCLHEVLPEDCAADPKEGEECLLFSAEHRLLEGGESAFLLTYSRRDPEVPHSPAGAALVTAAHPPEVLWSVSDRLYFAEGWAGDEAGACAEGLLPTDRRCYLSGTHTVVEDAETGALWAADTGNSRAVWLQRGAAADPGAATVLAVLDDRLAGWADWKSLNHLQPLVVEGRPMLLTTFKSAQPEDKGPWTDTGRLVLWDIADPQAPEVVWVWPEQGAGFLAALHHGIVQETAQGTLLLYAHSLGASDDPDDGVLGSVGIARFNGAEPPTYLADGVLPEGQFPLGFVREVEAPSPGDWLLITDSGCENDAAEDCSYVGRVLAARLPELSPEGQSGVLGDQRFVTLELLEDVRRPHFAFPYEADLFYAEDISPALGEGIGPCTDGAAPDTAGGR